MKSIFTLLIIGFLFFSSVSYSQSKFTLGIRVTPQTTTFRYTSGTNPALDYLKSNASYYFRVRTALGIGLIYNPIQRFRLGTDLLYSLQGGGFEQRKTNLNYLTLPLWIGYNASAKRKIIFTVQSGIQFSYLVSARMKYQDGQSEDIGQYVNKSSWGIPLAVGVKFKVRQTYFITTQLYLYSDFSTIAKTNPQFGVYNYIYPGIRISIDQNLINLK